MGQETARHGPVEMAEEPRQRYQIIAELSLALGDATRLSFRPSPVSLAAQAKLLNWWKSWPGRVAQTDRASDF
jgi:hypothetical protein